MKDDLFGNQAAKQHIRPVVVHTISLSITLTDITSSIFLRVNEADEIDTLPAVGG